MGEEENVPAYGDLGKSARNLLRSGYTFDQAKLKLSKPLGNLGLECDTYMNFKTTTPGISGLVNYTVENYGKASAKISSDGPLVLEYNSNGTISENVKIVAGYSFNIADSFQSCKLAAQYFNTMMHSSCSLTKDFDRSVDLLSSLVLKSNNFMVGCQCGFDTNTSEITKKNLAFAADFGGSAVHFRCIQIPKEYGLSLFQPVNEKLNVAIDTKMAFGDEANLWYLAAGLNYKLTEECLMAMKFDKNLQLGSNMQFKFGENVQLALGFNLDLSNPKSGQHKIGMSMDIKV